MRPSTQTTGRVPRWLLAAGLSYFRRGSSYYARPGNPPDEWRGVASRGSHGQSSSATLHARYIIKHWMDNKEYNVIDLSTVLRCACSDGYATHTYVMSSSGSSPHTRIVMHSWNSATVRAWGGATIVKLGGCLLGSSGTNVYFCARGCDWLAYCAHSLVNNVILALITEIAWPRVVMAPCFQLCCQVILETCP